MLFDIERTGGPVVLNRRASPTPQGAVYIGRGSPWGNPFRIGEHGNRDQVIELFEAMFKANAELVQRAKVELRGKDLVCYCKPARCHGDVLLEIANE